MGKQGMPAERYDGWFATDDASVLPAVCPFETDERITPCFD
jgi:hypothetical protein